MINDITQYPIGVFTTLQPILVLWLIAISFFLTVSVVALLSKNREWKWLLCAGIGTFFMSAILIAFASEYILDISIIDFDVISVLPLDH